jgi:hypothetical protein
MKDIGIVHGSAAQAIPLVIGYDKVYVHTDIKEVDVDNGDGTTRKEWQYHEVQYGKDEYLKKISEEKEALEKQTTDLQVALVESYETSDKQLTDLQVALAEVYEQVIAKGV